MLVYAVCSMLLLLVASKNKNVFWNFSDPFKERSYLINVDDFRGIFWEIFSVLEQNLLLALMKIGNVGVQSSPFVFAPEG